MASDQLTRRVMVARLAGLGLAGLLPAACATQTAAPLSGSVGQRTLVLVELTGGNDGLNTIIPIADPLYRAMRPRLAISAGDAIPLADGLAAHPSLAALMPAWRARDCAVLLGVGYPQPNRSHFRGIEIWDTASDAGEILSDGWVARALTQHQRRAIDAVALGRPYLGPLLGPDVAVVALANPQAFAASARTVSVPATEAHATRPAALEHVVRTQARLSAAGATLQQRLQGRPAPEGFPRTGIGGQMATAARLILTGMDVPVIKVSLGSFDTHVFQRATHARLLRELAEALAAFRDAMITANRWDDVLVLTYSEFGRRPQENGGTPGNADSPGTDHGTAAPHFALGGRVRGGLLGRQPPLTDLDGQDLRYTQDFRSIFATLARRWWDISPDRVVRGSFDPVPLFA
ncbi:MAG: DUF1501 domain-containing protein [Alphaproteobacteria bacterium]|nr:DUF1501 domain-containing protein [Alphaproteobacteria bacterium]